MTHGLGTQTRTPFYARTMRRFSPLVILAWMAFLVAMNVLVPQLEPVTAANRVRWCRWTRPRRKR